MCITKYNEHIRLTNLVDLSEMDPIPGTRLDFPDSNNVMNFSLFITPSDGLYRGAEFKFNLIIPQTYP